jgi:predicted RND superfamily exporter protein
MSKLDHTRRPHDAGTGMIPASAAGYAPGQFILRYRWAIIAISVLIAMAIGAGAARLEFNPDTRMFFGEDNPERLALDRIENTYSHDNNILIVLAPRSGNVFTRDVLVLIEQLTDKAWKTPYSSRVYSLTSHQHSRAEGDDVIIRDLLEEAASKSEREIAEIRKIALSSPSLVNQLISPTGDVTAISILINNPGDSLDEVPKIANFARAMAAEVRRDHPDIDVYLSGGIMADMTFAEAAERDLTTLVPIMIVLVFMTLLIGLSSFYGTVATTLVVLLAVIVAFGAAGWAGYILNTATASSPIPIMTLTLADCVHILTTICQNRSQGLDRRAAIVESLRINASPVAITSLTTAVGFLMLNFSASPPLRDLGNIVAVGVTAGWAFSFVLLPAVVSLLPEGRHERISRASKTMGGLADFVVRRRRFLLLGTGAAIAGLVVGINCIVYDDDFIRYFDESYPFRVDTDFMQQRLLGLHDLQFSLSSGEPQGISKPEFLTNVDAFAKFLRAQPEISHVSVLTDTLKRLNKNMHGDDPAHYRIPATRDLAAQYLLFYEMSVPFGHDLNSNIDVARSETRVTAFPRNVTSADIRRLGKLAEDWLARNAPGMATRATGLSMVYSYISERNVASMMNGTVLALVLISLILLFVLRSVKIGLISLVPNLFPAAMAFGLWGYLTGEVNLGISVVGAMTLGIVVDDTVHFLSKFLRARRERGMSAEEAVRYSFSTVGVAMMLTSFALLLGFGALAMSGFAITGQMGLLAGITIAFALFADFLFLPPLLILLEERRS